jgi:hypothetical protein
MITFTFIFTFTSTARLDLLFVWHVLAALHGPYKVEGCVREGLRQRVSNLHVTHQHEQEGSV